MPLVQQILETALYCDDLPGSARFYRDLLDLAPLYSDDRLVALDAGGGGVLLLFRRGASAGGAQAAGGFIPPHDGAGPAHLAFAVTVESLALLRERLAARRIAIESEVSWPSGATSIYLRDPDRHSVELATPGVWGKP
jgi:catechol 2,3-dioxygenase-like lactoylglutathione lyase family enzyme